ncbi:MAG: glycosyltransferase family 2 protein [Pseudomonadota bacterium]|nr:glycosyltransferase family 2 protein [Pseudomonadota bacterium]
MTIESARTVLVVIPTLNEVRTLPDVVRSLCQDLPAHARVTLVVADGGSTDGTVELTRRMSEADPALHLLANPRRIQSAAVNLAAQVFGREADVLVRCDAHAHYPVGFVRQLLETLDRTQADAVVVPMDSSGATCFQRAVAWVSNTWAGTGGSAHRGGRRSGFVDHGHHAAFRMSSFLRAGGYDESYTHNEDAELDCRQRKFGSKVYLDAEIRLGYHPRNTVRGLARQYFSYGKGRSRTVRRHPGSMRARQLALPANLVISALAVALAPMYPLALAWPIAYGAALGFTSVSIAWQQRSVCGLLSGFAAGTMHVCWAAGFLSGLVFVRESAWQPELASVRALSPGGRVTP